MGACLVVNNPKGKENTTLPPPSNFRSQIAAELAEKSIAITSTRGQTDEKGTSEKLPQTISRGRFKPESRSLLSMNKIESNRSLNILQAHDSTSRVLKQVVISRDIPVSIQELSERAMMRQHAHHDQDNSEVDEEIKEESSDDQNANQSETPFSRLLELDNDMLNKGLNEMDNRMIQLTMAAKEPLKLNAVKFTNGSIYNGEWIAGKRHGRGVLIWEDGSRYEGEWRQNFSEGIGKLTYNQNEIYQGSFEKNHRHGKGVFVCNGIVYEGEWRNDRQEGHGIQNWGNGEYYEGEWLEGYKHGAGQLFFGDSSFYKGEFNGNEIHGHGFYSWFNSRTYEGQWQHNRMSGRGKLVWNNGQQYEGLFKNDKMDGFGKFAHKDGSISQGTFQNGKKHGHFTETDPEGKSREVEYHMGKRLRTGEEKKHHQLRHRSQDSKTTNSATHSL